MENLPLTKLEFYLTSVIQLTRILRLNAGSITSKGNAERMGERYEIRRGMYSYRINFFPVLVYHIKGGVKMKDEIKYSDAVEKVRMWNDVNQLKLPNVCLLQIAVAIQSGNFEDLYA
jgi:hypothetical protein